MRSRREAQTPSSTTSHRLLVLLTLIIPLRPITLYTLLITLLILLITLLTLIIGARCAQSGGTGHSPHAAARRGVPTIFVGRYALAMTRTTLLKIHTPPLNLIVLIILVTAQAS
jgi:hypothetical protein